MIISIIAAIAENNAIGKNNDLLWHISDDLIRFKKLTSNHTIIMGRNTYKSLPKGALPNRTNIVITDKKKDQFEGCIMAHSTKDALQKCNHNETECFIIGGGMIYSQFLPLAEKLYITQVHRAYKADVFFPDIDYNKWVLLQEEGHMDNEPPFSFQLFQKNTVFL